MNLLIIFFCTFSLIYGRGLHEEFSWTRIDYAWPDGKSAPRSSGGVLFPGNTNARSRRPDSSSSDNNTYIYQNNIPMGANVWKDKLFITVPRRRLGVPSTLNYVRVNSSRRENVPLIPYPDWTTNTLGQTGRDGYGFVSVYRVAVDPCDRLWFVDTGRIELPGNPQQLQPTTLYIMDLKTDRIIQRHVFNSSLLTPNTNLASVTLDVTSDRCDRAFAYLPDLGGYALIVYSLGEDRSWKINHNFFHLEPLSGEFTIGGFNFQWNDGIFSIALSDVKSDGYRDAYFHSMAGTNQYSVSTRILRNETAATRSYHEDDFKFIGNRGERSQTSSSDLHKSSGVLFLGLPNQNALACWNINTPLSDVSIVQKDDRKMIYPSDVKICDDTVVVLTNTMPVFLYGNLDYDVINFRVWIETVDLAIKGTKCERRGKHTTRY